MAQEEGSLAARVRFNDGSLRASVDDDRRETREIFEGLSAEQCNAIAVDVWSVGLRAVAEERANAANKPRKPIRLSTIPPSRW